MPPSPFNDISVPLLRVLDAAANRAREGLRVAEDYARFSLDDAWSTEQLKSLRHALTAALQHLPPDERLAARETEADVGARLTHALERTRQTPLDVAAAAFGRLQEALRSLEEYGKLVDAGWAAEFEQIRYRSYTLQRALSATQAGRRRLADARLYVLLDGRASEAALIALAQSLLAAGADVLQLRDKALDDRTLLHRAHALREVTRDGGALLIINDRPDLARLSRADGVHVGQEELSVKDARTIVGPQSLIGVSTHSIEQARQAALDGANYIGVGPTFPSTTKSFAEYPGLALLRAVAAEVALPAFAIGGIEMSNLEQVVQSGLGRAAVSSSVLAADDPAAVVRQLKQRLLAAAMFSVERSPT